MTDAHPSHGLWSGRTARSWAVLALGRSVGLGLAAAVLALAGHTLGPGELGVLLLHAASQGFTALIATTGLMPVAVRDLARGDAPATVLAGSVRRALARSVVAAVVFVSVILAFGHAGDRVLVLCALVHLLLPLHLAAAPSLLHGDTGPLARSELTGRALSLVLAGLAMLLGARSAGWFLLAWTAGPALGYVVLLLELPAPLRRAFAPWRTAGMRWASRAETTTGLGDLVRAGYFHGGQWLAAAFFAASYASLGAPVRLLVLVALLPATLSTVVFGPLARGAGRERRDEVRRALRLALAVGTALALALGLTAHFWLQVFFPRLPDPVLAGRCLHLLAASVPALFGAGLCLPFLIARGAERPVLGISACGLAVMVAVFFVARPALGVAAGALGLTSCEWAVFLLAARAVRRMRP